MATEFNFNGRLIKLPGAYSQIKSGVTNAPLDFSYGNILIIDKDENNEFGGGSGITGEITQNIDSIYKFDNLTDIRKFIRGGELWDKTLPLFRPNGPGSLGVSNIYYIRALATQCARSGFNWTGGGANGGLIDIRARHEGLAGNGVLGDETRATQIVEVTARGNALDTISVVANAITLGTYIAAGGMGSFPQAAAELAQDINNNTNLGFAHGYTAIASGSFVKVFAPVNVGSLANAYTFAVTVTGIATATVGGATMAGGVDGTTLTKGFSSTMEVGSTNPNKFIVKFWRGTFTGLDIQNQPYDAIQEISSVPELIATSPEFDNAQEVVDWMKINYDFNNNFEMISGTVNGSGVVDATDLANTTGNQLFGGGSQTYSPLLVDKVLDAIKTLDYTFVYSMDGGAQGQSADNGKILAHLASEARFEKFMVVGGGNDVNEFESISVATAVFYNSDKVIVVHGGVNVNSQQTGTGLKPKDSRYKAAHVLGRLAGLGPQTPVTFKAMGYAGEIHNMTEGEKEHALDKGVLATGYNGDIGSFVVIAGINTLQRNRSVVNEDGTSYLISLKRIAAQLNKEIEINATIQLLGNQTNGPNAITLDPEIVKTWLKSYLKKKTATATTDNLIISFQDITVVRDQDALKINYAFVPNFEVNKLFFTGFILDPNLN